MLHLLILRLRYYESQADALAETNPISCTQVITLVLLQTSKKFGCVVDSNDLNGCLGLGHHITLNVNPIPATTNLNDLVACGGATADFNLDR